MVIPAVGGHYHRLDDHLLKTDLGLERRAEPSLRNNYHENERNDEQTGVWVLINRKGM